MGRAAAGVTVGDELDDEIQLDMEPRASATPRNRNAAPGGAGERAERPRGTVRATRPAYAGFSVS